METQVKNFVLKPQLQSEQHLQEITDFYDEATADYAFWSKNLNMHYGYMKNFKQFFNRESMLEQMNKEVFERLSLPPNALVLDSGCGTGASSRTLVKQNEDCQVIGLNIVESHLTLGKKLNRQHPSGKRIDLIRTDYHCIPLPNSVADGIFAMESLCHSTNKALWVKESSRLLKPGGRVVITDCFLQNPAKPMRKTGKWAYKLFRKCWSVPHLAEIHLFKTMLEDEGFEDVQIEDARWKVAPSVLHSPLLVLKFFLVNLLKGKKSNQQSDKNLKAVLLSILIGLDTRSFSYFIVSARKKD